MTDERAHLGECIRAVTGRAPLITRGVINAGKSSRPLPWRQHQLSNAIAETRALLDDLMLRQVQLGWQKREGDAA